MKKVSSYVGGLLFGIELVVMKTERSQSKLEHAHVYRIIQRDGTQVQKLMILHIEWVFREVGIEVNKGFKESKLKLLKIQQKP